MGGVSALHGDSSTKADSRFAIAVIRVLTSNAYYRP